MKRQNKGEAGVRLLRIGENIRHALADVFNRDMVQDPDLNGVSITVTQADVSPDLRNATIYVQPLGGQNKIEVLTALNGATGFLRGQLATRVSMKYLPKLRFELDQSFDEADHINMLLKDSRVRADLAGESSDDLTPKGAED